MLAAQPGGTNPSYALTIVTARQLAPDWAEPDDSPQTAFDLGTPAATASANPARADVNSQNNQSWNNGTPTAALDLIYALESDGDLPPGSYETALQQSGAGDFVSFGGSDFGAGANSPIVMANQGQVQAAAAGGNSLAQLQQLDHFGPLSQMAAFPSLTSSYANLN